VSWRRSASIGGRALVFREGSGGRLVADKAVPQLPQYLLPAEFCRPQLGQVSASATPHSPQKFLSSGLSLPQFGHRTSVLVCVAVDSPFTSLPRNPYQVWTISLACT
jgi:hypothetical protein